MELSYVTAGESHGPGLTVVVSGLPAGLELDHELIRTDLARRQAGYGRSPRQQLEQDDVEPRGGLRHGRTLGSPLAFFIQNRDHANWAAPMSAWPVESAALDGYGWRGKTVRLPRPGHADLAGTLKYGYDDVRNDLDRAERSPVRCIDPDAEAAMIAEIEAAKRDRDTLGGVTEVRAFGVPPGLGSHVSAGARLDGRLAAAMLSIQSAKAVEIGDAIASSARRGWRGDRENFPSH